MSALFNSSEPAWLWAVFAAIVVIARFAWVFPGMYLPRLFSKTIRRSERPPPWRNVARYSGVR